MPLPGKSGSVPEVTVSLSLTLRALAGSVTVVILCWRPLPGRAQPHVGTNPISAPEQLPFLLGGAEITGPQRVSTGGKPQRL